MKIEKETFLKSMKKETWFSYIGAILIFIFAVVLLKNPENFLSVAINIFGYGAIFIGILDLVYYFRLSEEQKMIQKRFMSGILFLCFGLIAFFDNALLKDFATLLLGCFLIYLNASRMELSLNLRKYSDSLWIYVLVLASLNVMASLFFILNPFESNVPSNIYLSCLLMGIEILFVFQNLLLCFGFKKEKKRKENAIVVSDEKKKEE